MSRQSEMQVAFTKTGWRRYVIEIWHDELNKYQIIRGEDNHVVEQKARAKMAQWDEMWKRKQATEKKRLDRQERVQAAAERTKEAQTTLAALRSILKHALDPDNTLDWESLKDHSGYPTAKLDKPKLAVRLWNSTEGEPSKSDPKYEVQLGFLDIVFKSRREKKEELAAIQFDIDHKKWKEEAAIQSDIDHKRWKEEKEDVEARYQRAVAQWEEARDAYLHERKESNALIDRKKEAYLKGETEGILDYCDIVLSRSEYPDCFPQSYDLDYNSESKLLIVDYELPPLAAIPTVREVKYILSRDEFTERYLPKTQINELYDNILYQVALRTIYELFEGDTANALFLIVFNGYVRSIAAATGQEQVACILSLQASKKELEAVSLAHVEPKACFKSLKGIGSSRLYSLTPIAPILKMERGDKRFIPSHAVADGLGEEYNLAAMDWQDFEHLIREVFEKEFASTGGEVKVTRASRDGGVDAMAFDPDPIRGGKIAIQAKRYTNTVGVSAVRDLYGTVINEGAAKGILVTTSDYGPDAYEFAKGKPLALLNGGHLLHLLEKHGHRAKIDLQEAKRILAEQEKAG